MLKTENEFLGLHMTEKSFFCLVYRVEHLEMEQGKMFNTMCKQTLRLKSVERIVKEMSLMKTSVKYKKS